MFVSQTTKSTTNLAGVFENQHTNMCETVRTVRFPVKTYLTLIWPLYMLNLITRFTEKMLAYLINVSPGRGARWNYSLFMSFLPIPLELTNVFIFVIEMNTYHCQFCSLHCRLWFEEKHSLRLNLEPKSTQHTFAARNPFRNRWSWKNKNYCCGFQVSMGDPGAALGRGIELNC